MEGLGKASSVARRIRNLNLEGTSLRHSQAGFNLVEMLVALAVILTVAAVGVPPLFEWASGLRVEMAAGEMAGILHKARIYSARHHTKVAVKFRTGADGVVTYEKVRAHYRDLAADVGVEFIDLASGWAADDLFTDYTHLDVEGAQRVAHEVATALER